MFKLRRDTKSDGEATTASTPLTPWQKRRRALRVRRVIAMFVMLWVILGLVWLVTSSGLVDPLLAMTAPAWETAQNMINDPLNIDYGGTLMKIAAVVMLHMGILEFMFQRR